MLYTVPVTYVILKDGTQILAQGEDVHVIDGTDKTFSVTYEPSNSRPSPSITCNVGNTSSTVSGSGSTRSFSFTARNQHHGADIFCVGGNTGNQDDSVSSKRTKLYVIGKLFVFYYIYAYIISASYLLCNTYFYIYIPHVHYNHQLRASFETRPVFRMVLLLLVIYRICHELSFNIHFY